MFDKGARNRVNPAKRRNEDQANLLESNNMQLKYPLGLGLYGYFWGKRDALNFI